LTEAHKIDGSPERIGLARWPEMTVDAARNRVAAFNGEIANGKNPKQELRAAKEKRKTSTLKDVFDLFIADDVRRGNVRRPKSPATVRNYRQIFTNHLTRWEKRPLLAITASEVAKLHRQIGEDTGYRTANTVLQLVKCCLTIPPTKNVTRARTQPPAFASLRRTPATGPYLSMKSPG
jgi:hypothetical protein